MRVPPEGLSLELTRGFTAEVAHLLGAHCRRWCDYKSKRSVCSGRCPVPYPMLLHWSPAMGHPLKLERYRED